LWGPRHRFEPRWRGTRDRQGSLPGR
jgi:hypothetical protein